MSPNEKKAAAAREAIRYVEDDAWIGVGTGSTTNFFIDELAKIKAGSAEWSRVRGSAKRLRGTVSKSWS